MDRLIPLWILSGLTLLAVLVSLVLTHSIQTSYQDYKVERYEEYKEHTQKHAE